MTNHRRGIRICGTGVAVPEQVLTSEEIDHRFGLPAGSVFKRYGVRSRHCTVHENTAELAAQACEEALASANLRWGDVDCLVAACATMDQALPYNAAMILATVGAPANRISSFDLGASCVSFLVALDTLSYLVDSGRYQTVIIVSADIATFSLDRSTLGDTVIFGDGAAAAVIRKSGRGESSSIIASRIETYPAGADYCHVKAGGSRHHPLRPGGGDNALWLFHMNGPRLFRIVSRELPRFVADLLEDAALTPERLHLVVPHQASRLALDHLIKRLRIDAARVVDVLADFGNQVAASLPSALHHAIVGTRLDRGDSIMLIGTGAGVTIGGIVMVY